MAKRCSKVGYTDIYKTAYWFPRNFKGTKEEILKQVEDAIDKRVSEARDILGAKDVGCIIELREVAYDNHPLLLEIEFNVGGGDVGNH